MHSAHMSVIHSTKIQVMAMRQAGLQIGPFWKLIFKSSSSSSCYFSPLKAMENNLIAETLAGRFQMELKC